MNKILSIAKHEFKTNAKRRGYVLFAVILPLLFVIIIAGQTMLGADVPRELIIQRSLMTPIPLPIVLPSIFGAIFSVAIFISSGFLLYGMVEEKENRLIEIILTSVSTRELLIGKTLGLGMLGILQIIAWGISLLISVTIFPELLWMAGIEAITIEMILLIFLFFVLGYSLFAILISGIGSTLGDTRQANQISGMITIVSLVPSWAVIFVPNPYSEILVLLSYIPITGPMTMAIRMLMIPVPIEEIIISLVITIIAIIVATIFVEKKLKQNLLVYDKKIRAVD